MAKPKKLIDGKYKSIKIKWTVYEEVKANKDKNGTPIGFFVEQAIEEKIKRSRNEG